MGLISRVSSRTYRSQNFSKIKMKQELSTTQKKIDIHKSILLEYSKQRDDLDEKIKNLTEILEIELDFEAKLINTDYTGPVPDHFKGDTNKKKEIDILNAKLVDDSGFPLPNVNLPLVTESRGKIRMFWNDRKALSDKIESTMIAYHALIKKKKSMMDGTYVEPKIQDVTDEMEVDQPTSTSRPPNGASGTSTRTSLKPFLIINSITPNSPSSTANLKLGDKIVKFGDLKFETFVGLKQIGEYVARNEDQAITLAFIRVEDGEDCIQFTSLVPKKWSGRGLLGCVINTL